MRHAVVLKRIAALKDNNQNDLFAASAVNSHTVLNTGNIETPSLLKNYQYKTPLLYANRLIKKL